MNCENCGAVLKEQTVCAYCGADNKSGSVDTVAFRDTSDPQAYRPDLSALTSQSKNKINELAAQIEKIAVQAKKSGKINVIALEEISDELLFLQEPIENEDSLEVVFNTGKPKPVLHSNTASEENLTLLDQLEILGQEGQKNGVVNLHVLDDLVDQFDDMEDIEVMQNHEGIRYSAGKKQVLQKDKNSLLSKIKGAFKTGN